MRKFRLSLFVLSLFIFTFYVGAQDTPIIGCNVENFAINPYGKLVPSLSILSRLQAWVDAPKSVCEEGIFESMDVGEIIPVAFSENIYQNVVTTNGLIADFVTTDPNSGHLLPVYKKDDYIRWPKR